MDPICKSFKGNQDMYGLGIRLGFYVQWLSLILCELLNADGPKSESQSPHSDVATIRMANDLFIVAEFVAILRQVYLKNISNDQDETNQSLHESIQDVDIHIVLLLCFGSSLFVVPLFIWRALTKFDKNLDPTRWHTVRASQLSSQLSCILLAAVSSFQIWFWTKSPDSHACVTYIFFFGASARMSGKPFRITNTFIYSALLVLEVGWFIFFIHIRNQEYRKKVVAMRAVSTSMRFLYCLVKVAVAVMVIIATELTIKWNRVPDINSLDSAGQIIPFVVSLFVLGRVVYIPMRNRAWRRKKSYLHDRFLQFQLRHPREQQTNSWLDAGQALV